MAGGAFIKFTDYIDGHGDPSGVLFDWSCAVHPLPVDPRTSGYTTRSPVYDGEIGDVNKSIACQTRAIELVPDDHCVDSQILLHNLARAHLSRFECLHDPDDLDKTIPYRAQIVHRTPDDDLGAPQWIQSLGDVHYR